jgi:hypothetical protein
VNLRLLAKIYCGTPGGSTVFTRSSSLNARAPGIPT